MTSAVKVEEAPAPRLGAPHSPREERSRSARAREQRAAAGGGANAELLTAAPAALAADQAGKGAEAAGVSPARSPTLPRDAAQRRPLPALRGRQVPARGRGEEPPAGKDPLGGLYTYGTFSAPTGRSGVSFSRRRTGSCGARRRQQLPPRPEGKAAKFSKDYTEGWVEFRDKRVAKRVAASLHNTPMGSRRRSPFRYDLWSLKYLHRFTSSHLSEHLAFERQVRRQRLRAEVAQAKRETDFCLRSVARGQRFLAADGDCARPNGSWAFAQRPTEQELRARKAALPGERERARLTNAQDQARSNRGLLAKIFGAPTPSESREDASLVRNS
ncbi:unnamed protein product [Rangifer tarandus platyrhynchus]|uniref:Activator of basal transcription 1 n=1 Tax=Rangifer tarandus platyrhynchus TaxID=3082113 RepID=A0ABN8Y968_RANTA|nr:unnamed protein product [Rangifer tarandus platyrhynchus]